MSAVVTPTLRPERGSFNARQASLPLSLQYTDRQALTTHLASAQLGGRDPAISFLYRHNAGLGVRPLDLAGNSAEGYAVVQSEVQHLASNLGGERQ